MKVASDPDDENLIARKLGGEGIDTPEDVVAPALPLIASHEQALAGLRDDIELGYQQSLLGDGVDGERFMEQFEAEIDDLRQPPS